ncbi:HAMP domain-containing sensor histidine kinase [Vibrio gallaecicus]|nr:HAMP domain-containing sensor histidine kinase [Vibrio gallaecicus]MDN3615763.1 HAMP domain-containing sensor histidine kinase [Vibrio gallaecicus]MDN3615905.1 HAMP domain-containing sensor histidine kinase [Vibrio gallaecicus]MDN3617745.1 HAMP domain-containing sensor histidine kinase [Vibrio gallaecicus]
MFARLYIGIVVGLVSTIFLFITLGDGHMRRSEIETFLNDGSYFAEQYVNQHNQPKSLYGELDRTGYQQFYIFNLRLIENWDGEPPCRNCEHHTTLNTIPVYLTDTNLYSAVFPLPNSKYSFVFSEIEEFFSPDIEWYEDSERHFLLALLIAVVFAIGASIYLPIRRLQERIELLVAKQEQFGKGKLSTRSNTKELHPISDLASSFNSMAEEIESKVKQSHIFAQAIPHEVRTPLSRIQLAADLLRREAPEKHQVLFDDIDNYIDDINELTSDIIMLSKLNVADDSFFELVKINTDLSEYCLERVRYSKLSNVEFESLLLHGIKTKCDCTMARLVLDNILKNAGNYTKDKVWVTLDENSENWLIAIEDNGKGIPVEKRNEVLLPFSRLDQSRTSKTGGFGLGLAIANSAAKKLGWEIRIQGSNHGGAKFIISMPKSSSLSISSSQPISDSKPVTNSNTSNYNGYLPIE